MCPDINDAAGLIKLTFFRVFLRCFHIKHLPSAEHFRFLFFFETKYISLSRYISIYI